MRVRTVVLIALAGICAIVVYVGLMSIKPNRSRMYARETIAIGCMMRLNAAQAQYNSRYAHFAASLAELGPPKANLIPADLASGELHGYRFALANTGAGYTISAVPVEFGRTGSRTFFTDQSLLIRQNYGPEPATPNSHLVK